MGHEEIAAGIARWILEQHDNNPVRAGQIIGCRLVARDGSGTVYADVPHGEQGMAIIRAAVRNGVLARVVFYEHRSDSGRGKPKYRFRAVRRLQEPS